MDIIELAELPDAGGYTPALRQLGTLADGSTAFLKTPTNDVTHRMLVREIAAYEAMGPQRFCPRVLDASPERLVLEDLRHGHWPPPWRDGDIERVLAVMAEVASTDVPTLPTFAEVWGGALEMWAHVDVDAVAALGFDGDEIARLTAAGREIEATKSFDGDHLVHLDLRSDNLCLLDDRVVLVDWNNACRGQADFDVVGWAPSLALEGGPLPWELLADPAPHHVAFLTGYFALNAPLPGIPDAPRVRPFQLAQLQICVPWMTRVLG